MDMIGIVRGFVERVVVGSLFVGLLYLVVEYFDVFAMIVVAYLIGHLIIETCNMFGGDRDGEGED